MAEEITMQIVRKLCCLDELSLLKTAVHKRTQQEVSCCLFKPIQFPRIGLYNKLITFRSFCFVLKFITVYVLVDV